MCVKCAKGSDIPLPGRKRDSKQSPLSSFWTHTPSFVSAYWCDPHMVMGKARQGGGAIQGEWPSGTFQPDNISSLPHLCIPLCKMNIAHFKKFAFKSTRIDWIYFSLQWDCLPWPGGQSGQVVIIWSGGHTGQMVRSKSPAGQTPVTPNCTSSNRTALHYITHLSPQGWPVQS